MLTDAVSTRQLTDKVITGFNTDIVHGGVTYHVQTEDKGVDTPLILSLVYDRGTILASKRTPYDDLIAAGFDEKLLAERLQKQHKLICAAVRAGRIEELKKMTAKEAALKKEGASAVSKAPAAVKQEAKPVVEKLTEKPAEVVRDAKPQADEPPVLEIAEREIVASVAAAGDDVVDLEVLAPTPPPAELRVTNLANLPPIGQPPQTGKLPTIAGDALKQELAPVHEVQRDARPTTPLTTELKIAANAHEAFAPAIPQPKEPFVPAIPQPNEELVWDLPLQIIDESSIVIDTSDPEPIISADAVEILTDADVMPRSKVENLEIEFLNETQFRAGERKTLNIRVFRGQPENFIGEAQVMVKVLGSSFRPLIFHARTNTQGIATVHLQLPQFRSGRGAILVRAISDGEEAELRQIVKQS